MSFGLDLDMEKFQSYVRMIYTITNVPKFRSFQYRLLMSTVITNIDLKNFKIRSNDLCTFCETERETVIHIFCECKYVRQLWSQIQNNLLPNICLANHIIIFNDPTLNTKLLPNLIILLVIIIRLIFWNFLPVVV